MLKLIKLDCLRAEHQWAQAQNCQKHKLKIKGHCNSPTTTNENINPNPIPLQDQSSVNHTAKHLSRGLALLDLVNPYFILCGSTDHTSEKCYGKLVG